MLLANYLQTDVIIFHQLVVTQLVLTQQVLGNQLCENTVQCVHVSVTFLRIAFEMR